MKVVHFTNNTMDGAGKAAYRLHRAMLAQGLDSKMIVLGKNLNDKTIVEIRSQVKQKIRYYPGLLAANLNKIIWGMLSGKVNSGNLFNFNISFVGLRIVMEHIKDADLICLHSVQYFLSPELINKIHKISKAPLVWTLMDIEPVTGGCHFNSGCIRFENGCGNCPQLKNPKENDLSRKIFNKKVKYLKDLPITFVAGSSWVADHIKRSLLFKDKPIKDIFLSVDEIIYKNIDKQAARKVLGLPQNKKIILFGCFNLSDKRKGAAHLLEALIKVPEKFPADKKDILKDVLLLTFGDNDGFSFSTAPFEWRHAGLLKDKQELAHVYHAADVLVVPSLDDCGPMMVNEAFACGLPVVSYEVGVSPDLIRSKGSGYIAKRYDVDGFCSGIIHCLLFTKQQVLSDDTEGLRQKCTARYQADQYRVLFQEVKT